MQQVIMAYLQTNGKSNALMGVAVSPLILWLVQLELVSGNFTGTLEWPYKLL